VRLLELESRYVADYGIRFDAGDSGRIRGWIRAGGDEAGRAAAAELRIPELGIAARVELDASGFGEFEVPAQPELWSPEQPKLYDLVVVYGDDRVTDRIGFRSIERRGDEIYLNGQPIYLRGISIHEEAPSREGRAWSEADARQTLEWARELNCNFVRLAHYPHSEAMLRMADEMGLLVWSEIPVYWTIEFDNPAVYQSAERQLAEMIGRDRNRASIILWSVANETPNHEARNEFLGRLVEKARNLDPDRLVTAALDTHTAKDGVRVIDDPLARLVDVIGINSYCGWYHDSPENCADTEWRSEHGKPVIVSEFGAGALHGNHGSSFVRWTEEYQARVYEHNITMLENMPFVRGTTPWILRDFRSPRRPLPGIQDYWNRKGLLSEQGERKQAWYLLKHFYDGLSRRQAEDEP
jgi:beta-glucuronidase